MSKYFVFTFDQAQAALDAYAERLTTEGTDPDRARAVSAQVAAFLDSPEAIAHGLAHQAVELPEA